MLACGAFRFDAANSKNPGRDRVVWSAGHCSPLSHSLVALIYKALRRAGIPVQYTSSALDSS
jgi:transketolase